MYIINTLVYYKLLLLLVGTPLPKDTGDQHWLGGALVQLSCSRNSSFFDDRTTFFFATQITTSRGWFYIATFSRRHDAHREHYRDVAICYNAEQRRDKTPILYVFYHDVEKNDVYCDVQNDVYRDIIAMSQCKTAQNNIL